VTVDIVLDLPEPLYGRALSLSATLVDRMGAAGHPSTFQLGLPFAEPGRPGAGRCEPHVSLFMLAVPATEVDDVAAAVRAVAAATAPVPAYGWEYRHNPHGAPELYFRRDERWRAVQSAVVAAAEPLRRGRLRATDPAGERVEEVVTRLRRVEPAGSRLRQLLRYGYDEIWDEVDNRLHPHVTLAWPADGVGPPLHGLTPATEFSGPLTHLGLYAMSGHGTCTERLAGFPLAATEGEGEGEPPREDAVEPVRT
jgi:hypothetical protein